MTRLLDVIVMTCVGVLCAAIVLEDYNLAIGAGLLAGVAALLDDIIRK
jgi:hypothetical protein